MSFLRQAYLALGAAFILVMALVPTLHPYQRTPHAASGSQTAQAGWDWASPYPTERTDESQAYIDANGYGYAPCMSDGSCDYGSGSVKDGGYYEPDYPSARYDGYDSYDTYDVYDTYDYRYSYGAQTGSYIASGLAQVPLIMANSISPQTTSWAPSYSYSTTYVPVQTQAPSYAPTYYAQPAGQPIPAQQTHQLTTSYSYASGAPALQQQEQVIVSGNQTGDLYMSAPISATYTTVVPQPIAQPVQATQASFFAVQAPIQRVAESARVVSGSVEEARVPTRHASCSLLAKPSRIAAGATTTLSWSVSDASTASITHIGAVGLVGSSTVRVATTTRFELAASGAYGTTTCAATVTIDPTMCLPGCPPGYVCTPVAATVATSTAAAQKKGFWNWLGF